MKPILAALALTLAPITALAQTTPTPSAPAARPAASPAQVASARAEGDRLIREANAQDLFTNITDGASARVRHNRSGLICGFDVGESENKIIVFEQNIGIPHGEDVGCASSHAGIAHTFYATRYRPAKSAKDALTEAAGGIKHRWPNARWFEGNVVEVTSEAQNMPQTWMAHYIVNFGGADHYTAARVADYQGWIYKQRLTVPMAEVESGQLLGAIMWMAMLADVVASDAHSV